MWVVAELWTRCGHPQCIPEKEDPDIRPHGPYYRLRRREPGKTYTNMNEVYLGSPRQIEWLGSPEIRQQLTEYMNMCWALPEMPTKGQVLNILERLARGRPIF